MRGGNVANDPAPAPSSRRARWGLGGSRSAAKTAAGPPRHPLVELAQTYIGEDLIDSLIDICGVWPTGPVDKAFKQPLESDKPVLLMSGSADPITPPRYADKAAVFF